MRKTISLFLLLLAVAAGVCAQDVATDFQRANGFYEQRDFQAAIQVYESIVNRHVESPQLYYNLGNAYFKEGDVGRAVLNYLRARRLDPADEDIRHNLDFAQQFSRVRMEGVQLNPVNSFLENLVAPYRLNTLAWFSTALFALFCVTLAVRFGLGLGSTMVRISMIGALVLVLAAAGLTTFKYRTEYLTRRVVIIAEESPVQNGPNPNAGIEFQGAPGLVAEVLAESGDYVSVLFENKRRGWIRRDLIAEV